MQLPGDYIERVYAGVLGKIIGVYLGRPFEGWSYEKVMDQLGEITYYVHEKRNVPLLVTDDDISGTFTFLRALPDHGNRRTLTAEQIGQTWLNYLIEQRTVLWWGGLGNSTEHTAYLRLKQGIPAPRSGSIEVNGKVVAEQIGAQIFIDGWALVSPGDPEQAASLARKAASVSHDGEAMYGAQVLAAMESQAFVESDIHALLDVGLTYIPHDSVIYRMIQDIRDWHQQDADWRKTRERIVDRYGYDRYGGNCHMVPNHALIILALLYGNDDFQRSLMIVNTAGWDTDCNSGNVGCLLGIKNGLKSIDVGPDWRGPVADRLYLPTADGGRAITDAVIETYNIVNITRSMQGEEPLRPKNGARFHFELPGAVQGFSTESLAEGSETASATISNVSGHSQWGQRSLAVHYTVAEGQKIGLFTPTFTSPDESKMSYYDLMASPTLYSGQILRLALAADEHNAGAVTCRPYIRHYGANDALVTVEGSAACVEPGAVHTFEWRIPATGGQPIARVGVEIEGTQEGKGTLYLDYLTWDGTPDVVLERPKEDCWMWSRAWINGVSQLETWSRQEAYRVIQNSGRGLVIQGAREWTDYRVTAEVKPHLAVATGIAVRVQGMRRYYALLLRSDGKAQLIKMLNQEQVLAEAEMPFALYQTYALQLQVDGARLQGWIDGQQVFDVRDEENSLEGGAIALVCEEGRAGFNAVTVQPVQ